MVGQRHIDALKKQGKGDALSPFPVLSCFVADKVPVPRTIERNP